MKRIKNVLCMFVALAVMLAMMPAAASATVTDSKTPARMTQGNLKWSNNNLSSGWYGPTPPVIYDGYIYTAASTTLYKINKDTGKTEATMTLDGSVGFATIPPEVGGGKIFYNIGGGKIEAVNLLTMKKAWVYDSKRSAQTISYITYKEVKGQGYVFTGTGGGREGDFFCVKADTGEKTWQIYNDKGFYWAGAYVDNNGTAYFGSDANDSGKSTLYAVKLDGKQLDTNVDINGGTGSFGGSGIRCRVVYDSETNAIYFTTKGGALYKFVLNGEGKFGEVKSYDQLGESTNTPIIYGDNIYVGTNGKSIKVVNKKTMTLVETVSDMPGNVQGEMVLSTAYEAQDKLMLYATYNNRPGGLYAMEFGTDGKLKDRGNLFVPDTSMQSYCISPVVVDTTYDDGTLYYKNDSNYLMAVDDNYKISTSGSAGINITATGDVESGGQYTVNISAKSGYKLVDVLIDNVSAGAKSTYTFSNVKAHHSIKGIALPTTMTKPAVKTTAYNKLKATWAKAGGATSYKVYRATSSKGRYKKVGTVKGGTASFTNSGLKCGKNYYYKVAACYTSTTGSTAASVKSSAAKAKPAPCVTKAKAKAGKKKATVTWKKAKGASGYVVYKASSAKGKYKKVAAVKKNKAVVKKLKKGKKYWFKVKAYKKSGKKKIYGPMSDYGYAKIK
ncbi:MAG: PQQ-binding-like beta-propeller repeat protein [Eubacteriaceae bacterium]|nr:PQQ-binding-like beta-propeller repeat protein [Eubacteriaceae bacterium]